MLLSHGHPSSSIRWDNIAFPENAVGIDCSGTAFKVDVSCCSWLWMHMCACGVCGVYGVYVCVCVFVYFKFADEDTETRNSEWTDLRLPR